MRLGCILVVLTNDWHMPLGTRTTSNQPDACLKRKMLHLLQITIRYFKLCGVNATQLEKTNVEMQQALRVKNTNISLKKKGCPNRLAGWKHQCFRQKTRGLHPCLRTRIGLKTGGLLISLCPWLGRRGPIRGFFRFANTCRDWVAKISSLDKETTSH